MPRLQTRSLRVWWLDQSGPVWSGCIVYHILGRLPDGGLGRGGDWRKNRLKMGEIWGELHCCYRAEVLISGICTKAGEEKDAELLKCDDTESDTGHFCCCLLLLLLSLLRVVPASTSGVATHLFCWLPLS